MSESVIFNSPFILVLYGVALVVNLLSIKNRTGAFLPFASAFLAVGTSAYAIVNGAGFFEVAAVTVVFLLINLIGIRGEDV